ncbi:two-component system, chemotaxis family, sensor kinase CheA [Cohnella sp. OV330]|uniref:ATP-binding protein n=1 Tax=Cohnella sp. OV330 TaxID=1855288 RepID=UPI0008E57812|nr:ATP-binding protein [Cohnella sp. OV330]SFB62090.1 two-component system, chemotaxis family, sensor kinase CheA [Cohnella sp. OV330]
MNDITSFLRIFFINVSTMLTLLYLASLLYKYVVYKWSPAWKETLFIVLAIVCGWTTIRFGFRFSETVMFDMRYLAVIVAPLFVRNKLSILVIGLGIGLARLSLGLSHAALVGCLNVVAMSLLVLFILWLARRRRWPELRKMATIVISVNMGNVLFIALFGIIPRRHYLVDIAPGTFLVSLFLCFAFMFILREFMTEDKRSHKLKIYTARLEKQYRISEEKGRSLEQAKQELETMYDQVQSASRYKTEFLANMSHELRTPLNSVLVLAQLLEENVDSRLSEEEVGYARIIHHSGKELLGLINDVLDLSKIEAGRLELDRSVFSVRELLGHMDELFRPIASRKRLSFTLRSEPDVPEYLHTDEQRLKQIINNLLSNALKFTHEGHVRFVVSRVPEGGPLAEGGLAFEVEDTGIGIAADKQEAIFDAFFQADGSISRSYGGTGLGLSIAKQFAMLLGGDIRLESELGGGSRFTLLLPWPALVTSAEGSQAPLGRDPAAMEEAASLEAPWRQGAGRLAVAVPASIVPATHRLLIVDDDEHNVYSLRVALAAKGFGVVTASSGGEALGLLSGNATIDLVLMDIMMPGMSGLEAIGRIREMPGRRELPIIALTAKAFAEDGDECLRAGADGYMTKPVNVNDLVREIGVRIREGRAKGKA